MASKPDLKPYTGSCHCGNISFTVSIDLDECYVCDCSICTHKGSIMNRVPPGNFALVSGSESVRVYRFNTEVAEHCFCGGCEIHTFHRPRSAPEIWSVNVRCLQGVDLVTITPRQVYGSRLD